MALRSAARAVAVLLMAAVSGSARTNMPTA
jgi:hypothetical protein